MPVLRVYRVETAAGRHIVEGSMSYKKDETLAKVRVTILMLEAFDFPFQFFDVKSSIRVPEPFELFIKIEDFGEKIVVIPKIEPETVITTGSSNASNGNALISSHGLDPVQSPTRVNLTQATDVVRQRNRTVDSAELARMVAANTLSARAVLEQHQRIVDRVNESQSIYPKVTFDVIGNLAKEPVDLPKFKLRCNFCCKNLTMIPRQRNLESNLDTHCWSIGHLNAVARSQNASRGAPVLSRRAGKPRVGDKRDRTQRQISGFLTSKPRASGFSSQKSVPA